MRLFRRALSIVFLGPIVASACEGECIIGITNAFLTNYTLPVENALEIMAQGFVTRCIHDWQSNVHPAGQYFAPFEIAYRKNIFEELRKRIFPGYFHGKCQQKDSANPDAPAVNPPGCPNPDCPVVCGTPGSLVHFYDKLIQIAFESVKNTLVAAMKPGSDAYKEVEKNIKAAHRQRKRNGRLVSNVGSKSGSNASFIRRASKRAGKSCNIKDIQRFVRPALEIVCGGTGTGVTNGLPMCSWEEMMKEYILTFP